ncbi:ABC transporter ATP-binding protein [Reichenbachiella versicolor]|uniref:ABC transporter ATP-binding protein n=1 Tax=Reichenbachiella versicolor TaxID=1821036 RepID=UPI000D6DF8DE|nr:ATP-binding cassette domain-containing protein [Reichenbachiella versicolor]
MLKCTSLSFAYSPETQFRFPDFTINNEEHLTILGESGIGKTTLLHLLGGLLIPKSGKVELDGVNLSTLPSSRRDNFRGQNIGMIFQSSHFIQSLSIGENMAMVQYLGKVKKDNHRINDILTRLGLENKVKKRPNELSQGQQQRASIAMAVLNSPKVILADEPTSSLDDKNCNTVIELLREEASLSKANLVVITHDQRLKNEFQKIIEL